MKNLILLGLWVTIPSLAAEYTVEMKSMSFSPKSLQIKAGDKVIWKNVSYSKHAATGESFNIPLISPKKSSAPVSFLTPGKFSYQCKVHGPSMNGVIEVGEK